MDFSLSTDIDSDLLHWDDENDEQEDKGSTNQSNNNVSIGGASSVTEEGAKKEPQHLSDQNNLLEPILPPVYFLSGSLPWDPSQSIANTETTKSTLSHQEIKEHSDMKSEYPSQVPSPTFQQEEWGASQISKQIAMRQAQNNVPHNQNAQDLAAAAARVMLPHQSSLRVQDSQTRTITDASINTGSSSSSQHSSSSNGKTKGSSSLSQFSKQQVETSLNQSQQHQDPPPFYLFDAPCELRANFQQAQRQNEMANFQDSNSFHYGMAVNGFHPQVNAQVNPIMPASLGAAVLPNGKKVELIDGRHKHKRKSSERNEREQQRAQKITELIDKLRETMEEGGWRVEMKSKYQILSHSTDYLKHLINTTKEKERNLQKTKTELSIRNQKLEEDNALQDGRSDPESITSSLTAGSSMESKVRVSRGSTEAGSTNVAVVSIYKGSKPNCTTQDSPEDTQEASKKCQRTSEKNDDDSNQSGGNMDSNNSGSGHSGKNISVGKMSSSLSDITDSNRGSTDGQGSKRTGSPDGLGNGSKEVKASFDLSLLARKKSETKADSSISSTAAVVSGIGKRKHDHRDTDIIFTRDRKRKYRENTSLDEGFELSYQEVFQSSNIPQSIATPAGRIVACNDLFFRVTGLTQNDVKRITIFSMVQVDKLSTLFDLVADSLRKSNSLESSSMDASSSSENSLNKIHNFSTVTLPCVPFPQELTKSENKQDKKMLFMNVTFMYDSNPSKRYIHCALTDEPGIGGKIGSITPQLLSVLFPPCCSVQP